MQFKSHNPHRLAFEEEISDFEHAGNILLPGDYKTYLLEVNGGEPSPNLISGSSIKIRVFLGMHNDDSFSSIYDAISTYNERIPFNTFPIAKDYFGNLLIMSVHLQSHGGIYFWNHEGEAKVRDGHFIGNISGVALSFSDLIEKFHEE